MGRAERRKRERRAARTRNIETHRLTVGENMVVAEVPGHRYEARRAGSLPPKRAGEHRWMAFGSWSLGAYSTLELDSEDATKLLDHENLIDIGVACWDCEQVWNKETAEAPCPADAEETNG